jgi:catechol 2,3-dioxygenase-like lactoylglutathione lyase family enzyme
MGPLERDAWHGARLAHTSLGVRDLDQAIAFYRAAFGATVLFSDYGMTDLIDRTVGISGVRCDLAQLEFPGGGQMLELIAFQNVPEERADEAPVRVGHGHVCFTIDDLDSAIATVEDLGARRIGEIVVFPECRAIYMREPAGSVFELEEPDPSFVRER